MTFTHKIKHHSKSICYSVSGAPNRATMAALPTEIITEILSRLPVKSLLRFKCVCKFWNSLIKTPNFIKLHLNQTLISNSDRHLLLYNQSLHSAELDDNHLSFSELQNPLSPQGTPLFRIPIYGSCNGIISISNKTDILLFNPLTKSQFKVPLNPNSHRRLDPHFYQNSSFGFGYDRKSDDYKVLKLVQWYTREIEHRLSVNTNEMVYIELELYSLNNNSWKSVKGIHAFILYDNCHGVLVNQALHYLVISKESHRITSFDLHTESFSFMDCPKLIDCSGAYASPYLIELGGDLCAFVNYNTDYHSHFRKCDLWVMKEYGNNKSWIRLFSIGHEFIQAEFQIEPIVYSKDLKRILLDIGYKKFVWYDLESKRCDTLKPHGLPRGGLMIKCFVGSLVSFEDKLHSERGTNLANDNKQKYCG